MIVTMTNDQAISLFQNSIQQLCPQIDQKAWGFLCKELKITRHKAKDYFIRAGALQNYIGFVCEGALRVFYINNQGEEINIRFALEGGYATDYPAFVSRQPSKYYMQCLEPCTIINLPYDHINQCYSKFPSLERFGRLIAEEALKYLQERMESFLFQDGKERYLTLLKNRPDLLNSISLTHISSYLGLTRPSLSRIRRST